MVGALGRARTAESPCVPVCFSTLYRTAPPCSTETQCFFKERRGKREEGSAWLAHLGAPARQSRRASLCVSLPSTVRYFLPYPTEAQCFFQERREKRVEGSAWLARLGASARQNRRASLRVSLPSNRHGSAVFNGSPLHSVHALPSTLFSLFSTSYLPHSFCDYYSVWLGRGCRGVDFRIIRPSVRATLIFQED